MKQQTIQLDGKTIQLKKINQTDCISLTDLANCVSVGEFNEIMSKWLRNIHTIHFIDVWGKAYKLDFNLDAMNNFKSNIGLSNFNLNAQNWKEKIDEIGTIFYQNEDSGDIFAPIIVGLEFCGWLSPFHKVYLIKALED